MNTWMKTGMLAAVMALMSVGAQAQEKGARTSPQMATKAAIAGSEVMIQYSSPAAKGRKIWGDLVPYGKVWRTGANEATTLTISSGLKLEGQLLEAGKYSIFTIPGESEWTIIINSVWDQWGAYNYDQSKDVMRFTAKPMKLKEPVENFAIDLDEAGNVTIKWEHAMVRFSFE